VPLGPSFFRRDFVHLHYLCLLIVLDLFIMCFRCMVKLSAVFFAFLRIELKFVFMAEQSAAERRLACLSYGLAVY